MIQRWQFFWWHSKCKSIIPNMTTGDSSRAADDHCEGRASPLNQFKRISRDHNKDAGRLHYDHTWHSAEVIWIQQGVLSWPRVTAHKDLSHPLTAPGIQVSLWVNQETILSLQGPVVNCTKQLQLWTLLFCLRPIFAGLTKQVSLWGYYWGLKNLMLRILQHKK